MHRRDLLRNLGATLAVGPLLGRPLEDLWRLGTGVSDQLARIAPTPSGPLGPFSAVENEKILTIAEHILPRTDTPGARDARVNEFIAVIVGEWYDDAERARFLDGLLDVDQRSNGLFGSAFLEASADQQQVVLRGLQAQVTALDHAGESSGQPFWSTIKSLTLYGYFTSELVQTEVLRTVIKPGRFDGCVTM